MYFDYGNYDSRVNNSFLPKQPQNDVAGLGNASDILPMTGAKSKSVDAASQDLTASYVRGGMMVRGPEISSEFGFSDKDVSIIKGYVPFPAAIERDMAEFFA